MLSCRHVSIREENEVGSAREGFPNFHHLVPNGFSGDYRLLFLYCYYHCTIDDIEYADVMTHPKRGRIVRASGRCVKCHASGA